MSNKNNNSLDDVANNLGIDDAIEMFEYALPRIIQRKEELCRHMTSQDWTAARKCSHKAIGSVRLYGSETLESLLQQVRLASTGEVDSTLLERQLSVEFDRVIAALQQWLSAHPH